MSEISIGKRILYFRKQKQLSQQELSLKLNISRQTISKWEQDLSLPDIEMLMKLAEIFGISLNQLIGVEAEPSSVSELYEQFNHAYRKLEKQNKSKNILQIILIILCIVSLGLILSLKQQLNEELETSKNNPESESYIITNVLKDGYDYKEDIKFTYIENFEMNVSSTDFKKWVMQLNCEISLKEYGDDTKIDLIFYEDKQNLENTYSLEKLSSNRFVLQEEIPLGNYHKVLLRVQTNGTYKTENLVRYNEFDFLTKEILNCIHLQINKDITSDNYDLSKLYYFSDIEENAIQANILFRFYLNNKKEYSHIFGSQIFRDHEMDFGESLPINSPIRMSIELVIYKESGTIYNEKIGIYPSSSKDPIYSYFVIDDSVNGKIF